ASPSPSANGRNSKYLMRTGFCFFLFLARGAAARAADEPAAGTATCLRVAPRGSSGASDWGEAAGPGRPVGTPTTRATPAAAAAAAAAEASSVLRMALL